MRAVLVILALSTTTACTMTPRYYAGRNLGQAQSVKKDEPGAGRRFLAAFLAGAGEGMQQAAAQNQAQPYVQQQQPVPCLSDAACGYGHNCVVGYAQRIGHCI